MLVAIIAIVCFVVTLIQWKRHQYSDLPPLAPGYIPLLGHALTLVPEKGHVQMAEWGKQLPIYRIAFGPLSQGMFVITDYSLIKQVLVTEGEKFSYRPFSYLMNYNIDGKYTRDGIADIDGNKMKEQRRFALSIMREFGMGKADMERRVTDQVEKLLRWIEGDLKSGKRVQNLHDPIQFCIGSIIASVIMGVEYQQGDKAYKEMSGILSNLFMDMAGTGLQLVDSIPVLRNCPGDPLGFQNYEAMNKKLLDHLATHVDNHDQNFEDTAEPHNFIEMYLKEMRSRKARGDLGYFSKNQLLATVADMWMAGQETTATTLRWAILYLIVHENIQERLYEEIKEITGLNRLPALSDRPQLPYVNACILEIQRCCNIADTTLLHTCNEDAVLAGYRIPRGATIVPSLYAVHMNPDFFPEPETFNPERFLSLNGKSVRKDEHLMPFGAGKRACLGESLAKDELFLVLASLVQRFRFKVDPANPKPSLQPLRAITLTPIPYNVEITKRL